MKCSSRSGAVSSDQKRLSGGRPQKNSFGAKQNSDGGQGLLQVYEDATAACSAEEIRKSSGNCFSDAPALFLDIGEKMRALSHITSFWRFGFSDRGPAGGDAEELVMVLQDFSKGFANPIAMAA